MLLKHVSYALNPCVVRRCRKWLCSLLLIVQDRIPFLSVGGRIGGGGRPVLGHCSIQAGGGRRRLMEAFGEYQLPPVLLERGRQWLNCMCLTTRLWLCLPSVVALILIKGVPGFLSLELLVELGVARRVCGICFIRLQTPYGGERFGGN